VKEYTLSKLAKDAGVSINVVRDYVVRGLVHPTRYTASGYGVYDVSALSRLLFIRASFECGVGLDELGQLCHAIDAENRVESLRCIDSLRSHIRQRQRALANVEAKLAEIAVYAAEQELP
jgi:MerR family mercuric resistance operon transcriptional regulator